MAILVGEHFDGSSSIPSTVTTLGGASFTINTAGFGYSPPNYLRWAPASPGTGMVYSVAKGVGIGTISLSVVGQISNQNYAVGPRICCAARVNPGDPTDTCYELVMSKGLGFDGLHLGKFSAGTATGLATVGSSATFAQGIWHGLTLSRRGRLLTGTVRRLTDGFWLNASGTWVSSSSPIAAIVVTDGGTLPASGGYAGARMYTDLGRVALDDFIFQEVSSTPQGLAFAGVLGQGGPFGNTVNFG